jgi:hypothetical protein
MDSDLSIDEVVVLGCMVLAFSAVCMACIMSIRWALILFYICWERLHVLKVTGPYVHTMSFLQQVHLQLRRFMAWVQEAPMVRRVRDTTLVGKICKGGRDSIEVPTTSRISDQID